MKANELQIGDWYQWYADGKYYQYQVKAEDFTKDYVANFNPIPLTAEILEKNGFEKDEDSYVYITNGNIFRVYVLKGFGTLYINCCGYLPSLHYVHELQRVLRSCELWELVDNFKI